MLQGSERDRMVLFAARIRKLGGAKTNQGDDEPGRKRVRMEYKNGVMDNEKIFEQLVAIVAEMRELCAVLRQNAVLSRNTGLLLKRHTARMNALLLEHGIEKLPEVVEENALLIEQNVILIEQRESDIKSLLRLQEKLDAIRAHHPDVADEANAAQAAGA